MTIHPDDDVAHNILREQQADAMPSADEAAATTAEWLASEGCRECGSTTVDELGTYGHLEPSCSAVQSHPGGPIVLCDDCAEARPSYREKVLGDVRGRDDVTAVAFYECGAANRIAPIRKPEYPGHEPTVAIRCRCGAMLDEVVKVDA